MLFNSAQFLSAFLPISSSIFVLLGSLKYRTLAIGSLAIARVAEMNYGWKKTAGYRSGKWVSWIRLTAIKPCDPLALNGQVHHRDHCQILRL
jgi:hypothetical protein